MKYLTFEPSWRSPHYEGSSDNSKASSSTQCYQALPISISSFVAFP